MQRNTRSRQATLRLVLAALAALLACGAAGAARGSCYAADIPEPLVLPDGRVHDAGRLQICLDRQFTPISALNRISVDGQPLGLFLAKIEDTGNAGAGDRPYLLFVRRQEGGLVLLSVSTVEHDRLQRLDLQLQPRVLSHWGVAEAPSAAAPPTVVLLAARSR